MKVLLFLLLCTVIFTIPTHAAPPSPNGWDLLIEAGKVKKGTSPFVDDKEPDHEKRLLALEREHVAQNAETFGLIQKALSLDVVRPPQEILDTMPSNATLRELARTLGNKARVEAADGNWEASAHTATDTVQMGVAIMRGASLIGALTGSAIQDLGLYHLKNAAPHLAGETLQKLIARLEKIEALRPAYAEILEADGRYDFSQLQLLLKSDEWKALRAGKSSAQLKEVLQLDDKSAAALKKISDRQIEENYQRALQHALSQARRTFALHEETPAPADAVSNLHFGSTGQKMRRLALERAATRSRLFLTALALRAYREEHGAYPATLQLLGGKYLQQIPRDPFEATRPLSYRLNANTYVLYSIGPDGVDNGGTAIDNHWPNGKPLPEHRRRFTEVDSKGDVVFEINR